MTQGLSALGLHRPSRPESIGGVLRAAGVYGVGGWCWAAGGCRPSRSACRQPMR